METRTMSTRTVSLRIAVVLACAAGAAGIRAWLKGAGEDGARDRGVHADAGEQEAPPGVQGRQDRQREGEATGGGTTRASALGSQQDRGALRQRVFELVERAQRSANGPGEPLDQIYCNEIPALLREHPEAVEFILERLRQGGLVHTVEWGILRAFVESQSEVGDPALIEIIEGKYRSGLKMPAVSSLGRRDPPRRSTIDYLKNLARTREHGASGLSLGELGFRLRHYRRRYPELAEEIATLLQDELATSDGPEDAGRLEKVLQYLFRDKQDPEKAVEFLDPFLRHPDDHVRQAAISAVAADARQPDNPENLASERLEELILVNLADPNGSIATPALSILDKVCPHRPADPPHQEVGVAWETAPPCRAVAEALVQAIKIHPNWAIRRMAIRQAGPLAEALGNQRVLEALEVAARREEYELERQSAREKIEELSGGE